MKEELFNRNELRKVTKDLKAFERSLLKNHRGTPSKSTPRLERTLIEKKETSASNNFSLNFFNFGKVMRT